MFFPSLTAARVEAFDLPAVEGDLLVDDLDGDEDEEVGVLELRFLFMLYSFSFRLIGLMGTSSLAEEPALASLPLPFLFPSFACFSSVLERVGEEIAVIKDRLRGLVNKYEYMHARVGRCI